MKHLWFDPTFGVSGDMMIGAFLSLGVPEDKVNEQLAQLQLDLAVRNTTELRCGLHSTRAIVEVPSEQHHHRTWSSIDQMLATADLPEAVVEGARRTFRKLGETEAAIHGTSIDEVHFHEVGGLDAIADIVGSWICWDLLEQPEVSVGPFGLGYGTVMAAHGELPLPAPAVAALLTGWQTRPVHAQLETVTPTGAAILTTMASTQTLSPPAGLVKATGRGAGGKNPSNHPNVVSVVELTTGEAGAVEQMLELSTNVDDVTAEVLAYTVQRCLDEGAADAWTTPITMKKGRSAVTLTVLCEAANAAGLRAVVMSETGTLGVRQATVDRFAAARQTQTVQVRGHNIRIKVGPHGAKPEFDDCALAARALKVPLRQIQTEALDAI